MSLGQIEDGFLSDFERSYGPTGIVYTMYTASQKRGATYKFGKYYLRPINPIWTQGELELGGNVRESRPLSLRSSSIVYIVLNCILARYSLFHYDLTPLTFDLHLL